MIKSEESFIILKKVGEQLCLKTNFLHSVIMISMILWQIIKYY